MREFALAVVVATRNRGASLRRTLDSLDLAQTGLGQPSQIIVVDNGSSDATPELLRQWCADRADRLTLRVDRQGKSRAVNAGLERAEAPLIAFTDDDVEVSPEWLSAVLAFFAAHPDYAAAMGRTLPPPGVSDPAVLARIPAYPGAVPMFDRGSQVCDLDDLFGCNMAVRWTAFETVGRFNERLGPGASGLSEDAELAQRLLRAGLRIGYMAAAVVYHEVDAERLTDAYYSEFQRRLGRSEYAAHPEWSSWRATRRMVEAGIAAAWWAVTLQSQRRAKAWARVVKHADAARWLRQEGR